MKPEEETLFLELFMRYLLTWTTREVKTLPWTSEELSKVIKSLKNNKCRDPNGMINKLFKPGVIGSDLQIALLDLFNLCKSNMQIPDFMKTSNIVNVWKKKGDKMDIDSYRGIFITNILKAVILKLIHQDKSETIDSHMSDFQIGGRKGKKCKGPFICNKWNNSRHPELCKIKTNQPDCGRFPTLL